MRRIDLDKARTSSGARVLAGRDRGVHWRGVFRLDEIDRTPEPVEIIIPPDIISINISFFLGMFGKSVRALGKDDFVKHYIFKCDEDLRPLINLGVDQALKTSTALSD
jgi:hypothetical protein